MKSIQLVELIAQANINGVFTPQAVKKMADSMNVTPAQVRLLIGRCEIAFTEFQNFKKGYRTIPVSPYTHARIFDVPIKKTKKWIEF